MNYKTFNESETPSSEFGSRNIFSTHAISYKCHDIRGALVFRCSQNVWKNVKNIKSYKIKLFSWTCRRKIPFQSRAFIFFDSDFSMHFFLSRKKCALDIYTVSEMGQVGTRVSSQVHLKNVASVNFYFFRKRKIRTVRKKCYKNYTHREDRFSFLFFLPFNG